MLEVQNSHEIANIAYEILLPQIGHHVWLFNIKKDVKTIIPQDSFWRDVLIAWTNRNHREPQNIDQIMNLYIWGNSRFKIGNKPVINSEAIDAGLIYIKQLFDENYQWLLYRDY